MSGFDEWKEMTSEEGLPDIGIGCASLGDVASVITKILVLEGRIKTKIPEKKSYSIFDQKLDGTLKKQIDKTMQMFVSAIESGTLEPEIIQRNLKEEIQPEGTYLRFKTVFQWLEERGVDTSGEFFDEYADFEMALWNRTFEFIEAEKTRLIEMARGTLGKGFEMTPNKGWAYFKENIELKKENEQLRLEERGEKPLSVRERNSLLKIIGALVDTILAKTPTGKPYSTFKSKSSIIEVLLARFDKMSGLSERLMQEKFASGAKAIEAERPQLRE